MEWSDTAVVLRLGQFRERDVWLHLLTKKHGVVSAFAFGGRASRHRFPGCLDVLNRLAVRLQSNRTGRFFSLTEGLVLHGPRLLRKDVSRLGMALNCARFVEAMDTSPDETESSFDLTDALLDTLEQDATVSSSLPLWFRFRMASDQGFAPDFSHCSQCGELLSESFSTAVWQAADGRVRCLDCCAADGHVLPSHCVKVTPGMAVAFSVIAQQSPSQWHFEGLSATERQSMAAIAEELIEYNVGLTWKHGYFGHV